MTAALDLVVPYHGDPALLRDCVRSVLAQTSPDWRLVVVDDAYPDPWAGDWLRSLGDPRISYHRNATNLGVNRNFQRCLDLAESELVTFLGCDDLLLPSYVDAVVATARSTGAAMVHPGVRVIGADGRPARTAADSVKAALGPRRATVLSGQTLARGLLRGPWTYFPAVAWRTATIRPIGFRPGLDLTLDVQLMLDVALAGGTMAYTPTPCFAYRRHRESASSPARENRRFEEERRFFHDAARSCREHGWAAAARTASRRPMSRLHALTTALGRVRSGQTSQALTLGRQALS